MEFEQIKELLALLEKSNAGEFLYEKDGLKLRYRSKDFTKKVQQNITQAAPMPMFAPGMPAMMPQMPAVQLEQAAAPVAPAAPKTNTEEAPKKEEASKANYKEIRSPMVGTFYRSSSPDKPPFVKVGDSIQADSTVCLVEAMKLFNEIKAEMSGRIVKVLVEDNAPVEYDQVLFLVEPA